MAHGRGTVCGRFLSHVKQGRRRRTGARTSCGRGHKCSDGSGGAAHPVGIGLAVGFWLVLFGDGDGDGEGDPHLDPFEGLGRALLDVAVP
eukprot:1060309-Prymnesium_polylepis.3